MSLRDSIQVALLLAIGTILHSIVPGYGSGMKPDLLLSMLFIVLMLRNDSKTAILAGILAGMLSALTTSFPGGQIPNIIDKLVTTGVIYFLIMILNSKVNAKVISLIVGVVGTVVSGLTFLGSALFIAGLPAPFGFLVSTVVLPATIMNTIAVLILYPVVKFSKNTIEGKIIRS
jgi:thiamine transporter ThiT